LQIRENPTTGRIKIARRRRASFLALEKRGNRISNSMDEIVNGAWGAQSVNIRYRMVRKDPVPST